MCLTGAMEAQSGRLEGRGEGLAEVAWVQSGSSRFVLFQGSSSSLFFLILLVDAEGVCVLSVL